MSDLRGKFIVFDGGEGCGKSTQTLLLQRRLEKEGYEVLCVRDPGTTGVGELIRGVLLNPVHRMGMRCEMLLYMAARAEMMVETILPALQAGRVVLSDRFVSSTLAYQLGGDGITTQDIHNVAEAAIKGRWPDLTMIFDMPFEHSRKRVQPKFSLFPDDPRAEKDLDRIEQRPREYHEQVRKNYLAQIEADPKRYRLIHADRAVEEVHEEVWQAANSL